MTEAEEMGLGVEAALPEHRGCWKRRDAWALLHSHPRSASALLCALGAHPSQRTTPAVLLPGF